MRQKRNKERERDTEREIEKRKETRRRLLLFHYWRHVSVCSSSYQRESERKPDTGDPRAADSRGDK
jgi:hypothetical protein